MTLLELVVVLAIVGILLALAAPALTAARDGGSVRAALGELDAIFSVARHAAILRREAVAIAFDSATGTVEVRSGGWPILRRALGAGYGVSIRANRDSVVYDPRGLGYGLSNLTVTVRRGRVVHTLTMSRLGRVKW